LNIAIQIMGVYETAIDTILVSFLEDEAENDGKNSACPHADWLSHIHVRR